jgi:hypothetical protein
MHAVVVEVDTSGAQRDEALKGLRERVVPTVKEAPGFEQGVWLAPDDASRGMGVMVFDNEEHARAAADQLGSGEPTLAGVTVQRVTVREVGATA